MQEFGSAKIENGKVKCGQLSLAVQNVQNADTTKRTGEKSRTPISPIGPIGPISPMKKYADGVSKMRQNGVQNWVCCRAVRAGRRIETPLAERERYIRKHSAQGLSKMRVTGVQNVERQIKEKFSLCLCVSVVKRILHRTVQNVQNADTTGKTDRGEVQDTHKPHRTYRPHKSHENILQTGCPK